MRLGLRLVLAALTVAAGGSGVAFGGANEAREVQEVEGGFAGERIGLLLNDEVPRTSPQHVFFGRMTDFGRENGPDATFSARRSTYVAMARLVHAPLNGIFSYELSFDYQIAMFSGHAGPDYAVDSRYGKAESGMIFTFHLKPHKFGFGFGANAQYRRRTVYDGPETHEYEQHGFNRPYFPANLLGFYAYTGKKIALLFRGKTFSEFAPLEHYVAPSGEEFLFTDSRERYPFEISEGFRWSISSSWTLLQSLKYVGSAQAADEEWSMRYRLDAANGRPERSTPRERAHMEAAAGATWEVARLHRLTGLLSFEEPFYAAPHHASIEDDNLGHTGLTLGYGYFWFSSQVGAILPSSRSYTARTRDDQIDWRSDGDEVHVRQQKYVASVAISVSY
jgi:hypothetical protein